MSTTPVCARWPRRRLTLFVWCCVSAEDPSENYVKLRDYVLAKLCQDLPSFAADKLHLGFSDDMVKESQEKLKINKVLHVLQLVIFVSGQ